MFQTIVIVILLGIIGYLILDKKNIKLDDLKAFLKDGEAKLRKESGPILEKAKSSLSSASETRNSKPGRKKKLYLLSKAFLLLVVIGFLMPVSYNQNGFQIAEYVNMSGGMLGNQSSVAWTVVLIHTVFWAALLGVVLGGYVLYQNYSKKAKKLDIVVWRELLVLAAGILSVCIIIENVTAADLNLQPQTGAYLIGVGYAASLALLIMAIRSDDSNIDSSPQGNMADDSNDFISCPYCAERIRKQATICRFCGRSLKLELDSPAPAGDQGDS